MAAVTLALGVSAPVSAQTALDRASGALGSVEALEGRLNQERINTTVAPYETAAPPETGLTHTGFEDRIRDIRQQSSTQGRVLRATEDSARVRPRVEIDGQGPLFDVANDAHTNAETIAGRYFSSENGTCETTTIPVTQTRDAFCESLPARANRLCTLTRDIWVDRTDTYRCDARAANFIRVCTRQTDWQCQVESTPAACIARNVQITGASVSWNGPEATIWFPAEAPHPASTLGASPYNHAALKKHAFNIWVLDRFVPTEAIIRGVGATGVLQITSGTHVYGTYSNTVLAGFGGGGACPYHDRDGLLLPATKGRSPGSAYCDNAPNEPMAVISQSPLTAASNYLARASAPTAATGWDLMDGLSNWMTHRARLYQGCEDPACDIVNQYCNTAPNSSCHHLASLNGNDAVVRQTLTPITLAHLPSTDPVSGPRSVPTAFTARVVYRTGRQDGGAAHIRIRFDGPCCDSFSDEGTEICE